MSTFVKAVPLLVQDDALSSVTTIGDDGEPVLRVEHIGGSATSAWTPTQATSVTNDLSTELVPMTANLRTNTNALVAAVGDSSDTNTDPTVIGLLKSIIINLS